MAVNHPRCELCAGYPDGAHCWTHTYEDGDPDEGRYRCRHCSGVGRECDDCGGTGVHNGIWTAPTGAEIDDEDDCPTCQGYGAIDETVGEPVIHRRRSAR